MSVAHLQAFEHRVRTALGEMGAADWMVLATAPAAHDSFVVSLRSSRNATALVTLSWHDADDELQRSLRTRLAMHDPV